MRRITLRLSLLVLVVPACRPATAPPTVAGTASDRAFDGLLGMMRSRLAVMHDVARWKWVNKAPIENLDREAALLRSVADEGRALGIDPETTRGFFLAQIEAAKLIQRADFRRWEATPRGPGGEVPDLAGVLRPRIDGLNRELLAALARAPLRDGRPDPAQIRSRADDLLTGDGIDAEVRAMAIQPLLKTPR